jgi:hypothetical protein
MASFGAFFILLIGPLLGISFSPVALPDGDAGLGNEG